MTRTRSIAAVSFLFTILFFLEYTPILGRVHIPFDLEAFHYPLADYAFQSIRHGRLPQWDPSMYCGMPFVANTQAALFYPAVWLMFALSWAYPRLPYQAIQALTLAHVWLAFVLCLTWLRHGKKLHLLASILGAGIFAFSGYMLLQLQHFGLVCGYAWMPLAFLGIDRSSETRRWQPMWMLALAMTMCVLAGYPFMWVVFAVCVLAYAAARKSPIKIVGWTIGALVVSSLFSAIQLMPAAEAARRMVPETRYAPDSGIKDPAFYISYFIPNYFDFGRNVDVHTNPGKDYLYLGAAGLAGLALLLVRRRFAGAAPPFAVLIVSLTLLVNPFDMVGKAVAGTFLSQVLSDWYFLAGVTAAVAALAAIGLDSEIRCPTRFLPGWYAWLAIAGALLWVGRLVLQWAGPGVAAGPKSAWDAVISTLLCVALVMVFARSSGRIRYSVAVSLLVLVAFEYRVFGTNKRFNAGSGPFDVNYLAEPFPGLNSGSVAVLSQHPWFRVARDVSGPPPCQLRHAGITTAQGFDPLLTDQYKTLIEQVASFRTNREFEIAPENEAALRLLGVGYFATAEQSPTCARLMTNRAFRLMEPDDRYYKVFELVEAQPAFTWEESAVGASASLGAWEPERRLLHVSSPNGGVFRLSEQFYPGWVAAIDNAPAQIQRCHQALQCVAVPAGEHILEFRYHSRWLTAGAMISLFSVAMAAVTLARRAKPAPRK